MEKIAGEMCEMEDILLSSRFQWRIPRIKSVLQEHGDECQSPPHTFCNAEWTLMMMRCGNQVDISINGVSQPLRHKYILELEFNRSSNERDRRLYREKFDGEFWDDYIMVIRDFPWNERNDFDVIINGFLQCYDCEKTPAFLSKRLGSDFLELLISGEDSDVTINVKDRTFKIHKNIIRARSPVFFSMLKHDMEEKRNGRIDIPDCEPEAFQIFLEYIYSGELKNLSKDIVWGLCYITDKYESLDAKAECVKFMSKNLSLETFCDTVTLAMRHKDVEVFESADQFFVDNWEEIIQTDAWLDFLKENPAAANDFFKKLAFPDVHREKKRKLGSTTGKQEILKKTRR